ncbi:MAG TPA: hypothetical protein VN706_04850 [Gemmatimonadaceae bacterium]|nr:hypothetical protein [Gemmatimonadaceae bacterium]
MTPRDDTPRQMPLDLGDVHVPIATEPSAGHKPTSATPKPSRTLIIESVQRVPEQGDPEELAFQVGVNLLAGPPNAGKSKWIRFIDFVLGDGDPPEITLSSELAEKYRSARVTIRICGVPPTPEATRTGASAPDGTAPQASSLEAPPDDADAPPGTDVGPADQVLIVERRWKEVGMKGKVFVDGEAMTTDQFGAHLLQLLGIPVVHYPRGDPFAPRAWPVLSWRSLFRHAYREERFWSDLADKQFEGEQHAALMQFLGLAEALFSVEYGDLVAKRKSVQMLRARKESYMELLHQVTNEIGRFAEFSVAVTADSVNSARTRLLQERQTVSERRLATLRQLADVASNAQSEQRLRVQSLLEEHGQALADARARRQSLQDELARTNTRVKELEEYRESISREHERLQRAQEAGVVLAELKVTHCPVCDQAVTQSRGSAHSCYLCLQPHDHTAADPVLGSRRLAFEADQLSVERKELSEVIDRHEASRRAIADRVSSIEETIGSLEGLIRPTQVAAAAVLPPDLSLLDQEAGGIDERLRTLDAIAKALAQRDTLNGEIDRIEVEATALEAQVESQTRDVNFEGAATMLEEGFNSYFNALNQDGLERWPEGPVSIRLRKRDFWITVTNSNWRTKLGATLACFFLNAYHYALLSLSGRAGCNYPGLAIIDFPPTLADDRELTDEENYLIVPFIQLLSALLPVRTQLIVAGRAFEDLPGAHRIALTTVYK